jgi:predicted Zn-dependent peptidase
MLRFRPPFSWTVPIARHDLAATSRPVAMVYSIPMRPIHKTLQNGLRVVLVPMQDNPAVTAMVLVAAGSEHETPAQHGLAHFLEHMCFKGTTRRPGSLHITRELEGMGARTNAFTGRQMTGYYAKAQSRHLPKILDIIADLYLDPLLPEAEIEKEKGVIIEEINMYDDMPQYRVDEVFDALLYGDTVQGKPIIGTKDSVRSFTRDDLIAFRSKHYNVESSVVVIAGAFDPKETMQTIRALFASVPTGGHPKHNKVAVHTPASPVAIEFKKSEQTHVMLGVKALPLGHRHELTQNLLASVLGGGMSSRLFTRLREEMGACYYVHAHAGSYAQYGTCAIAAGVPAARIVEVVAVLREELERMKDELVTDQELKIAKNIATSSLVLGLETSNALANYYGGQAIMRLPHKTPHVLAKELRAVSAADIRTLARKLFAPEALRLALVGPVKKQEELERLLR